MGGSADAMSRVLQGVKTGVGFIDAGVIIRGRRPAGAQPDHRGHGRGHRRPRCRLRVGGLGGGPDWRAALTVLVLMLGADLERWTAGLFSGANAKAEDERLAAT